MDLAGSTRVSYDLCKRKWLGLGAFAGTDDAPGRWHLPKGIMLHEVTEDLPKNILLSPSWLEHLET